MATAPAKNQPITIPVVAQKDRLAKTTDERERRTAPKNRNNHGRHLGHIYKNDGQTRFGPAFMECRRLRRSQSKP